MLNTALRTSLRDYDSIVGYVFLDVCYVLQFYREELAEPISHNNSLIILDHPCISLYILDRVYQLICDVALLPRALFVRGKRARGLRPQNGEVHNGEDTTGKGSPKGEKGRGDTTGK